MRVLWTGVCFIAGAVLSLAAVYALSEAVAPVYNATRVKVALFQERSAGLQAVSVGNSHSRSLDFGALGLEGMHLYEGGQDFFEAAYLADYAAERAPRLRYVLMTASYGLERLDHASAGSTDLRGMRRRIYARTPAPRFIPGDRDLWLSGLFAPVARPDHWAGVGVRLLRPDLAQPPVRLTRDGRVQEPPPPPFSFDSARRAGTRPPRRLGASDSVANDPTAPARAVARLEGLARDLHARGILLVLYTPPYHETYRWHVARWAGGTRRSLAPLLKQPNVVWLDFGTDSAFMRRDDLFRDPDHMNHAGARAFSTILSRCLASLPKTPAGCRRVPPLGGE